MLRAAWLGLRLRCPVCRHGRIYRSLTDMNQRCPHCGLRFEREEGDFLGAMLIAYSITSVLVVAGVLLVELVTDLTANQHILLWSAFGCLFLIGTYRNMKGIWIGILHVMMGLNKSA